MNGFCLPVFLITSGARYSGVPQRVYVSPFFNVSLMPLPIRLEELTVVKLLCKPKVHQFEVTLGINEHVFWFHISIGDALMLVEEFENEDHLGDIEAGSIFVKARCSA